MIEFDEPAEVVKAQLEQVTSTTFDLSKEWEYEDLYYTEVLGLWVQFTDCREAYPETPYTYQIEVGYLREKTGLDDGKEWVHIASVEIARMVTRNLNCKSAVLAGELIFHRFDVENQEVMGRSTNEILD